MYYESHDYEPLISYLMKRKYIDGLIVITYRLKKWYMKDGVPKDKILVAPDGVDLKMFYNIKLKSKEQARRELGIPIDKKIICYTGHLYEWKGVHILALSLRYLSNECICYFVGGTEEDIRKFRKFIKDNGISNAIIVGYVSPSIVHEYLVASDVVVLPNIRVGLSEFTSPLKLFEYMASRRPIVASDLPAIREILNEKNAVLVKPENPKSLAEGIQKVLNNDKLAIKIAIRAYRDILKYTWDKRAEKILKFIGILRGALSR